MCYHQNDVFQFLIVEFSNVNSSFAFSRITFMEIMFDVFVNIEAFIGEKAQTFRVWKSFLTASLGFDVSDTVMNRGRCQ